MTTATSKWLTRCLGASCAMGALVLVGELQAQDFAYTNTNGTITITGYTGSGGDVLIPATIDGFTHLGGALGAFYGCSGLTNVTIGKGLAYLGAGAFNYCNNLPSVYFQGNAPTLGIDYFGEDSFHPDELVTLYYLPGTTGWSS